MPIQFRILNKGRGFEFICHNKENNFGPKVNKTAQRTVDMKRPKMDPPFHSEDDTFSWPVRSFVSISHLAFSVHPISFSVLVF